MLTITHTRNQTTSRPRSCALISAPWGCLIILTLLLASGCRQSPVVQAPSVTPTAVLSTATAWPTTTSTATATCTATAWPTATPTPLPTATPDPLHLQIRLGRADARQGSTLVIYAEANQRCEIEGAFAQQIVAFSPLDEIRSVAFVGIHALAEVGEAVLYVTAQTASGQRLELETPLRVVDGGYGAESLTFTAETSKLLDPSITEPELAYITEIYGQHTQGVQWLGAFAWPLEGPTTSAFGTRRQYGDAFASYHAGIDIDGETGDPVRACAAGTVVLAEMLQVRGNAVIIDHGAGVLSGYYHLSQMDVAPGQRVEAADIIGLVGSTGLSTGSHLHWELRVGGVAVSPTEWIEQPWVVQLQEVTS